MYEKMSAKDWYNKGLEHLQNYAILGISDQEYKDALTAFNKALELNPKYADAWYQKANVYTAIGEKTLAEEAYKKAANLNPQEYKKKYKTSRVVAVVTHIFLLGILFALSILIGGWTIGYSLSEYWFKMGILFGGIIGVLLGGILTPLSFTSRRISVTIKFIRNAIQIVIIIGLIAWLIHTIVSCYS